MATSLYVHIPFCLKRCIYCDFVSGIYNPEKSLAYIKALKKEILTLPDEMPLSTLYIGGGTPTALSTDLLMNLINPIFDHFRFAEDYEATIEANPGTLDREKLQSLRSSGINRVSIGIQSFSNEELSFLGRIHTREEAENAVSLSRDSGFKNIGIDLIYGIPGQDIDGWRENLERAVSLKPEHISTYELTVEQGTALYERLKSGDLQLPDEDKIIDMYEDTIHYLTSKGFGHYEISNFALPDHTCRHNLNYWDRGEYFGAGLGAHSFIDGKRSYNSDNLEDYLKAVSDNRSPVINSEDISDDNALSEALFLGLRKTEGIIAEDFSRRYRKNILSRYQKELKDLQETGLIDVSASGRSNETVLKLTGKGLLVSNEIFTKFI
jgi:oxygen-independent coproporphyrinogen-3 oxidase